MLFSLIYLSKFFINFHSIDNEIVLKFYFYVQDAKIFLFIYLKNVYDLW